MHFQCKEAFFEIHTSNKKKKKKKSNSISDYKMCKKNKNRLTYISFSTDDHELKKLTLFTFQSPHISFHLGLGTGNPGDSRNGEAAAEDELIGCREEGL